MIAEVLVEIKAKNIDKTFSYLIPTDMNVQIGIRVLVPFGKQKLEGFVLNVTDIKPEYSLKEIISVIDEEPILNKEMLRVGEYISKKTLCNLINAYQTMLPAAIKAKNGRTINKKIVSNINNVLYTNYFLFINYLIVLLFKFILIYRFFTF